MKPARQNDADLVVAVAVVAVMADAFKKLLFSEMVENEAGQKLGVEIG